MTSLGIQAGGRGAPASVAADVPKKRRQHRSMGHAEEPIKRRAMVRADAGGYRAMCYTTAILSVVLLRGSSLEAPGRIWVQQELRGWPSWSHQHLLRALAMRQISTWVIGQLQQCKMTRRAWSAADTHRSGKVARAEAEVRSRRALV